MVWLYAAAGLAVALVGGGVLVRNRQVALRQQLDNARGQIDVQLARRHDLIPGLVEIVKGALAHERAALEALLAARGEAARLLHHQDLARSIAAESQLTTSLSEVLVAAEAAPELRALGSLASLQEELTSTENRIAFARQHYHDAAARLNAALASFPGNVVAGTAGGGPAPFWTPS